MRSLLPREPSWLAVAAGQVSLGLWLFLLLLRDLLPLADGAPLSTAASPTGAAAMGVFGFAVPVILGMFPRLGPGLLGLAHPSRRAAFVPAGLGVAVACCAVGWTFTEHPWLLAAAGAFASAGGAALMATIFALKRGPKEGLAVARAPPFGRISKPGNLLLGAGLLYLIAGAALLALVAAAPAAAAAWGLPPSIRWPLHLLTVGFIATTVFGIGTRMFSAFSGTQAPPAAVWVIALCGVPAPAGIAAGLALGDARLVALSGALALTAAVAFCGTVAWLGARQRRRRRAWYLMLAASLMLVAGECLGLLFALDPAFLVLAAVHGQINTLGFAGLMIFGVLFELSGGRAARPDAFTPGISLAFVWPAALALRTVGTWYGVPAMSAVADVALLGTLVLAAMDAHPASPRGPPTAGGASPGSPRT